MTKKTEELVTPLTERYTTICPNSAMSNVGNQNIGELVGYRSRFQYMFIGCSETIEIDDYARCTFFFSFCTRSPFS